MDRKNKAIKESEEKMDINALVAKHVMGWRKANLPGEGGPNSWRIDQDEFVHCGSVDEWKPTENIAQAWQVVEHFTSKGYAIEIYKDSGGWHCVLEKGAEKPHYVNADMVQETILLTALKAVGYEV